MYALIGITGKVGGSTARALLNDGDRVRGIVRNTATAVAWRAAGVELSVADMTDAAALEAGPLHSDLTGDLWRLDLLSALLALASPDISW